MCWHQEKIHKTIRQKASDNVFFAQRERERERERELCLYFASLGLPDNRTKSYSCLKSYSTLQAYNLQGGFSELWAPGKYRNGGLYICTHLSRSTLRFLFLVVMLAAAQWCPIAVSNVSTFFMYMYNGILSFTFTFIHLADNFIISRCRPRNSNWFTVEIKVYQKQNKL